jgi:TAG lipase/lysophosphatidylethanolamine acyltransferase
MDSDSPVTRLAELFNVNHIVLSQANPYFLPFAEQRVSQHQGMLEKVSSLISSEVRHRLYQVNSTAILESGRIVAERLF